MATKPKRASKKPYREKMSEAQLQAAIVECAETFGYFVAWIPDWLYALAIKAMARGRRGDRQWSPPGFPDLVIMQGLNDPRRPARLIFAELKSDTGRLRVPQHDWLRGLQRIPGIEVYVWRPDDWLDGTVDKILRNGPMADHKGTEQMMLRKPEAPKVV